MKNYLRLTKLKSTFLLLAIIFCFSTVNAQDFMMQGWYWDYPKTCNGANWAGTLQGQAAELGNVGFTYVWLPPMSRASFGNCSNGYDPKDLYDLGEYGGGATGFGTRADVDALILALANNGVDAVADVVYNHRDGGDPEINQPVEDYITIHYDATKNPFPSDRYRCVLPLGGSSGNGTGDYYFKISSKSQSNRFHNKPYIVRMETSLVGNQGGTPMVESEPNGGGDCGEAFDDISLGVEMIASIDASGCTVDEFKLTLTASDFDAAGDELIIFLTNQNGDYSDHRIYGIWNASTSMDVVNQLDYQTYTDFNNLPSGQGGMSLENFRPNSTNTATTSLTGDWDWLWFFYDYDQSNTNTRDVLFDWTDWLWDDVNIRGFRMDAVKHFDPAFIGDLLDHLHYGGKDPGLVVGEIFDSNPFLLSSWVSTVQANMDGATLSNIDVRVFDFALRDALKQASDNFGYDVRNVFNSGVVDGVGGSGFNVVTFLNNHDFRGPGEPIQNNPVLGYAYLLTNNRVGLPSVFYPDYYGTSIPNAPLVNLKAEIDQLMTIHSQYIFGAPNVDYLSRFSTPYSSNYISGYDNTTLFYQISGGVGGKEVIVVINYAGEALVMDHQINMANVNASDTFDDLTGNAILPQATLNGSNQLRIEIPAQSYAVYVQNEQPAPVELLEFKAVLQNKDVALVWEVAAEDQMEGYSVERSFDGQFFTEVGWQKAINEFSTISTYEYLDSHVPVNIPLYYRLKIFDQSGAITFSPVREVVVRQDDFFAYFTPNPVRENGVLKIKNNESQRLDIEVFHISGQKIWTESPWVERGLQTIDFNTDNWVSGIYYLRVTGRSQEWVQKIIK